MPNAIVELLPLEKKSLVKSIMVPREFEEEVEKIHEERYGDLREKVNRLASQKAFEIEQRNREINKQIQEKINEAAKPTRPLVDFIKKSN